MFILSLSVSYHVYICTYTHAKFLKHTKKLRVLNNLSFHKHELYMSIHVHSCHVYMSIVVL